MHWFVKIYCFFFVKCSKKYKAIKVLILFEHNNINLAYFNKTCIEKSQTEQQGNTHASTFYHWGKEDIESLEP